MNVKRDIKAEFHVRYLTIQYCRFGIRTVDKIRKKKVYNLA